MFITVDDIENTDKLERIMREYERGSDDVFDVVDADGEVVAKLTPYDGPYEAKVQECEDGSGDCFVPLPKRLLAKNGWDEKTPLDVSVNDTGNIVIERAKTK